MRIYDIAFWLIFFFLAGVFAKSFNLSNEFIMAAVALAAFLFLLLYFLGAKEKKFLWFSGLCLFVVVGAFYYFFYDNYQNNTTKIIFNKKVEFSGIIVDYPEKGASQKLIVALKEPFSAKILVKLKSYPEYFYGNEIKLSGVIKKPEGSYKNYLSKEGVVGFSDFPKVETVSSGQSRNIKSFLFSIKTKIISGFGKIFSFDKAAFMSGITLGERAEFSKELKENMSNSGTTHLVALSGYNISIIGWAIAGVFGWLVGRKWSFYLTILVIGGFVLMAGAQASVVRAAIMGGILLLSFQVSRLYSFRNAIAVCAFVMILVNPKILVFDIGFQLSFLALLGIVYLDPAIRKTFHVSEEVGFLNWRQNLFTTLSAQLAVAPLLIIYFAKFSFFSLLANILILSFIPLTMGLGFIVAVLNFVWFPAAKILGWPLNLFLGYELGVINFFGKFSPSVDFSFGIFGLSVYYLILALFVFYARRFIKISPVPLL